MDFMELMEREVPAEKRKQLAKSGAAMHDGSYPIENEDDLKNAIQAIGRASDPAAVKAHIKTRAKALGCEDHIPNTWESARGLFANVEALDEAAGNTFSALTGNLTITVIKPGVSKNNRYYSAALLKKSVGIFEGAKMFVDHQTDKDAAARPEGSVKDWVGTITGVKAESDGTIKASANIHNEAFRTNLVNLKKAGNLNQMGVSIRAFGEAKDGEVSGKRCKIVESLLGCKSVDFVTFAGAGGQVDSMSEAVDPDDVMLMDAATLRAKRPDLVKAFTESNNRERPVYVKKNNGASHNGHGGTFTESDPNTAEKEALVESVMQSHNRGGLRQAQGMTFRPMTENDARLAVGLEPKQPEGLTEREAAEYHGARALGLSESDALVLAKLPFKEANRRF